MGLTRLAFYEALASLDRNEGGVSVVEPILRAAYEREAEREWHSGSGDSPHGARWSTSFHASAFPGADEYACGRAALYGLMDLPDDAPRKPALSAMFDQGTDLEHHWVRRLKAEGVLLSKSPAVGDDYQTVFVDPEHWLTGASDAIILPQNWRKSFCIEVKTTSADKVKAMRENIEATPFSHEKYVRQLKTYIGSARELPFAPHVVVCAESWALLSQFGSFHWCPIHESVSCEPVELQLDPPDDGELIYSSREEPLTVASYYVAYDAEHMHVGREKLALWRDYFLRGELPPHPREGQRAKWSVDPCKWCPMKALGPDRVGCKVDYESGTQLLSESTAIKHAREIRPGYDYEAQRQAVLERWHAEDLSKTRTAA